MLEAAAVETFSVIANIAGLVMFVDWLKCRKREAKDKLRLERSLAEIQKLVSEVQLVEGYRKAAQTELIRLGKSYEDLRTTLAEIGAMPERREVPLRGHEYSLPGRRAILRVCLDQISRAQDILRDSR